MSNTQAEPSVRERIEKALDAGATSALFTHPRDCNMWKRNEALAMACHPDHLRLLFVQHDATTQSLRAEIERLRTAGEKFVAHYPMGINPFLDEAFRLTRAALSTQPTEKP